MSAPLAGKIALITGATKGIGRSTAKHLISLGAKVVVSYGGDTAGAEAFIKEVGAENAIAIQGDAGSLDGIDQLVQATVQKHQKIDILIPNAGRLSMTDIEHLDEANFDKSFAINVKGPMFLVQKVIPYMPAGGKIVFVSTTQNFASTVTPPYMLYCATKGAIDQMTRVLAKDLAKKNINVNCVAPGPTGTDLFFEGKPEAVLKQIASLNPFNRIGEPDEVAAAFAFLCSPESRWVNGQVIKINGGQWVG
ncbi:hypothetical protein H2198_000937 [Neophaeococcomyces mojaviensis]|uniref:Uncharacterized protein n=1 Tax=Neophaeococcomyces mojaviensis TaxID=3383035 RepID=A0ACC3AIL1_9EURO|nr:hypothetical protein H2198_000937 [Knufia sp. JES_112]